MDWGRFEAAFAGGYSPDLGAAAKATRLMVGLQYLKYTFHESDESVVARWVENPYGQSFCGFTHLRHECPIHPRSLSRWRKRVGAERLESLLHEPEVQCIRKGKAHQRYEFGQKVAMATTHRGNGRVAAPMLPNNPYDGHTLSETLQTVERVTGVTPSEAYVDKGYRGHGHAGATNVHVAGQGSATLRQPNAVVDDAVAPSNPRSATSRAIIGWIAASWPDWRAMRSTPCWPPPGPTSENSSRGLPLR